MSQAEKIRLRQELKAKRDALSPAALAKSDEGILQHLLALEAYQSARVVFCFVSVRSEPDTRQFILRALQSGKQVCVPRCLPGGGMEARRIMSLEELAPAPFGLLEPGEASPLVKPEDIDLVIAPCLACDATGCRLGYGGGYYDRFLAKTRCPSAALCRAALLRQSLPAEVHDKRVDYIITEQGVQTPL